MSDNSRLERLVAAAVRAPSSHNTQPWIFEAEGGALRLLADRTRALPVNDPEDRELTISCGCALFNLRAAAAAEGLGARVTLLPEDDDPDLLAVVSLEGAADGRLAALARQIEGRRTFRKAFAARPPAEEVHAALAAAAEAEGAWLDPVEQPERRAALADLVEEGDAAQWADPRWRRELAAWMHPRRQGDGLSLPGIAVPLARFAVRRVDLGERVGAHDGDLAKAAPMLVVLGTGGDEEADWLAAGQALERVLLAAAEAGLQASYLNQPVQVPELRTKLRALLRPEGSPQTVLRIGYPSSDAAEAPRRPVEAVFAG
ncbi:MULTISPECIES: hypothetical protein [unclassified Rhodosalinus]|uniref:Acg family FMN-binding oxidoreductase n=1 Tax=unclassified Rhodosalinus TaxID=2630183 RepID=UPI00352472D5